MKSSSTDTELQVSLWRCAGKDIWVCGCEWASIHMRLISGSNLEINCLSNMSILQQKTSKEYTSNYSSSAEIRYLQCHHGIIAYSCVLYYCSATWTLWRHGVTIRMHTVANTSIFCTNLGTLNMLLNLQIPDQKIIRECILLLKKTMVFLDLVASKKS